MPAGRLHPFEFPRRRGADCAHRPSASHEFEAAPRRDGDALYDPEDFRLFNRTPAAPGYIPDRLFSAQVPEISINLTFASKYKCSPRRVSIFSLFYQGDVRWENQFRRNRNRQNFVTGSYFPTALKSRKNPAQNFRGVTLSYRATCGMAAIFAATAGGAQNAILSLRISV